MDTRRDRMTIEDSARDSTEVSDSEDSFSTGFKRVSIDHQERVDTPEVETPPKRKRGRPPGSTSKVNKNVVERPSLGPYSASRKNDNSAESPDHMAVDTPPKRKRGRPPGSKSKTVQDRAYGQLPNGKHSTSLDDDRSNTLYNFDSDNMNTPSAKKRGRPPGSKNKSSKDVGPYSADWNMDNSGGRLQGIPIDLGSSSKRKPGRPPGSKKKTTGNVIGGLPTAGPYSADRDGFDSIVPEDNSTAFIETPTKKKRGRPPGSKTKPAPDTNGIVGVSQTNEHDFESVPSARRLDDPELPTGTTDWTEQARRNGETAPELEDDAHFGVLEANRDDARQMAERAMQHLLEGELSEDEGLIEEDDRIRRLLLEAMDDSQAEKERIDHDRPPVMPDLKPAVKKRGRPLGSRRKRTPTPPAHELPPHERYFYQNRPGAIKTSTNTLSSIKLLDHDEYFGIMNSLKDSHLSERQYLEEIHAQSFPQWRFELHEGFNICLYGWGSKRALVKKFANWLHSTLTSQELDPSRRIIVINGYVSTLTARDILSTIQTTLHPRAPGGADIPTDLSTVLSQLPTTKPPLTLLINSIDSPSLRRPAIQTLLATLSSHPAINMLATADVPNFPLLWDSTLRETFNFLFHDCTSFAPFRAELDVVDSVHDLLGRSGRRAGGRDAVAYVLRSLPENARHLYRVIVSEQLAVLEDSAVGHSDAASGRAAPSLPGGEGAEAAVEYRVLYQKAAEEWICSSEMAFRTLLKEFHDHQMIRSRKDSLGTEVLWAPFRKEELEAILEDLIL